MSINWNRKKYFNLYNKLTLRTFHHPHPSTISYMYQNLLPKKTVNNVSMEAGHLRKFTPDGKFLITFSRNQSEIVVYEYLGVSRGKSERATPDKIFKDLFRKCFSVQIGRDFSFVPQCCLFTRNSNFLIAGGFKKESLKQYHPDPRLDHNDYLVFFGTLPYCETYRIMLINLSTGLKADKVDFPRDMLLLSTIHGLSVSVSGYKVAILSLAKQNIHLFDVSEEGGGRLFPSEILGQFLNQSEYKLFFKHPDITSKPLMTKNYPHLLTQMKQKILRFLFIRAQQVPDPTKRMNNLLRFYFYFEAVRKMKIWKIQLLDPYRLFIRYSHERVIYKRQDQGPKYNMWVFYDLRSNSVYKVFADMLDNLDELMLYYEENRALLEGSHMRDNIYAMEVHKQYKQGLITARNGGPKEAIVRTLSQLPFSCQAVHESPYLDRMMFRYNGKFVPVIDRPWSEVFEHPIGFFHQHQHALAFQPRLRPHDNPSREMVAFTYHPIDPFIISVQRGDVNFYINFHMIS